MGLLPRYLGHQSNAANGLSRFSRGILGSGFTRRSVSRPQPYALDKEQRMMIGKKLVRAPHYIPAKTKRAITDYEKDVVRHAADHTTAEVAAARADLNTSRIIKGSGAQRQYVKGKVAIVTDAGVLKQKDQYHFEHHGEDVAGDTFREVTKPQENTPTKPTQAERLAAIHPQPQQSLTPYDQPWRKATTPQTSATVAAPHARDLHLGSMSSGAFRFGVTHLTPQSTPHYPVTMDAMQPAPTASEPAPVTPEPPAPTTVIEPTPIPSESAPISESPRP